MAIKEASAPEDVVIVEGELTYSTVVHANVLVVGGDFDFGQLGGTGD